MKRNWEYKKLGECGIVVTGNTPSKKDAANYSSNDFCFVKPNDIEKDGVTYINQTCEYISKKAFEKSRRLPKGAVLTTCIGIIGKVAILEVDATCNQQINAIIPNGDVDSKFLAYSILSIRNYLTQKANAPVVPIINKGDFSEFLIPVPPLEEQSRVVAELDLLTGIIDKQNAQLKEFDNLAQSIFYDMFGDPIENPKKWPVKKLGELSSLITNGNTPKGGEQVYVDKGILFLRSQNVWKNYIDYDDVAYIDDATNAILKKSVLHHNDILITKTGRINTENSSLGRSALFDGETGTANINGHVYLVRLLKGISHTFVLRILISKAYREYIRKVCVGGIDKRQINKDHVEDFPIIVPPLALQQSFAEKIQSIEKQKETIRASIAGTQKLLDYTMDKYFG